MPALHPQFDYRKPIGTVQAVCSTIFHEVLRDEHVLGDAEWADYICAQPCVAVDAGLSMFPSFHIIICWSRRVCGCVSNMEDSAPFLGSSAIELSSVNLARDGRVDHRRSRPSELRLHGSGTGLSGTGHGEWDLQI